MQLNKIIKKPIVKKFTVFKHLSSKTFNNLWISLKMFRVFSFTVYWHLLVAATDFVSALLDFKERQDLQHFFCMYILLRLLEQYPREAQVLQCLLVKKKFW